MCTAEEIVRGSELTKGAYSEPSSSRTDDVNDESTEGTSNIITYDFLNTSIYREAKADAAAYGNGEGRHGEATAQAAVGSLVTDGKDEDHNSDNANVTPKTKLSNVQDKDQETVAESNNKDQERSNNCDASIRVINPPNKNVVELVAGNEEEKDKERRRRLRRRSSRVSFTTIEVREYDRIVGQPDPEVETPLSIGWEFEERKPTTVDDWEVSRPPRRGLPELFQNHKARKELLKPARRSGFARSLASKAKKLLRRLDSNITQVTATST